MGRSVSTKNEEHRSVDSASANGSGDSRSSVACMERKSLSETIFFHFFRGSVLHSVLLITSDLRRCKVNLYVYVVEHLYWCLFFYFSILVPFQFYWNLEKVVFTWHIPVSLTISFVLAAPEFSNIQVNITYFMMSPAESYNYIYFKEISIWELNEYILWSYPTPTPLQIERLSCTMLHHIIIVGFRALWCCNVPSDCQLDPERNIINLTCLQFSTYQVLYLVGILLKIQMTVCVAGRSLWPLGWERGHCWWKQFEFIWKITDAEEG